MVNYSTTVYETYTDLTTAIEAIDNTSIIHINKISVGGDDKYILTIGGTYSSTTGPILLTTTDIDTATYSLLSTDAVLLVNYTATGAVTITLPTAQVTGGREIIVKDASGNATTNNITIETEGAETIDGSSNYVILGDYDSVNLLCNGTNWLVI